jgi:hypothetical protein
MIVAIMQPYFFPYVGYFQLMHAVDAFVYFDDVQYIERGWVNRNRIRVGGKPSWLTLPVAKASRALPINARRYLLDPGVDALKRKLRSAYARAPAFADVYPRVEPLLDHADDSVSRYNENLCSSVASMLGVQRRWLRSSALRRDDTLRGQERIIDICMQLGATRYVNPIGGVGLYDRARFEQARIDLRFVRTRVPLARLDGTDAHLSVIDGLMHEGAAGLRSRLPDYDLVEA